MGAVCTQNVSTWLGARTKFSEGIANNAHNAPLNRDMGMLLTQIDTLGYPDQHTSQTSEPTSCAANSARPPSTGFPSCVAPLRAPRDCRTRLVKRF